MKLSVSKLNVDRFIYLLLLSNLYLTKSRQVLSNFYFTFRYFYVKIRSVGSEFKEYLNIFFSVCQISERCV